eukprot:TRINITY_DN82851_c0_g1_i1.p1 TRINITY_DN82851_c0_g1~~TRINITY_DN82851_c0_g1_i1.p1  ORF type:complete len:285 (-),score=62.58 TRINITY_DN82851_c0_g1_i1:124-897(-)
MANRNGMDRKRVRNIFAQWDPSGDGKIQLDELEDALGKLGIPKEKAERLFNAADVNHDGDIQFEEFVDWLFQGAPDEVTSVTHTDAAHTSSRGQALQAAREAAGRITPQDLQEINSMYLPPNGGLDVVAGLLVLMDEFPDLSPPTKKKKAKIDVEEIVWKTACKVMKRRDFRFKLQHFDIDSVPNEAYGQLHAINQIGVNGWAQDEGVKVKDKYVIELDEHAGEHLGTKRVVSRGCPKAVQGLCGWVQGMREAGVTA